MNRIALLTALLLLPIVASSSAMAATASCLRITPAQQRAQAQVIFDGVALDSATPTGIQRFRVTRYLKSHGPRVLRVNTGNVRRADGTGSVTSVSIMVTRGQRWRIFGRGNPTKALLTNACNGSHRL